MLDESLLSEAKVSRAAAQRLSQYLRVTGTLTNRGGWLSSGELADAVGVSAAQVRRDLAALGHLGQRGVGYDANGLTSAIRKRLGVDRRWRAVLVGVGHLAKALVKYRGLSEHGFDLVALYDSAPAVIGSTVSGLKVEAVSNMTSSIKKLKAELGIITVPAESAQGVADTLVNAGLKGLMNFAPVRLRVPSKVQVISVDLAIQLQQLAFRVHFGESGV